MRQDGRSRGLLQIVRLSASDHQIAFFPANGRGKDPTVGQRVSAPESAVLEMHGPVGAQGQRLAEGFLDPRGPEAERDEFRPRAAGSFGGFDQQAGPLRARTDRSSK